MSSLEDLVALEPISLSKPNELYRCVLTHKILRYWCNVVNKKMHKPATGGWIAASPWQDDLLVRRLGGFSECRIPVEAEIYELRRVALNDLGGSVSLVDLVEPEINLPTSVDRADKKAVNLGARFFGLRGIRRQRVTHRAASADNPARQFTTVRFPIVGIENAVHIEMRVAGQQVNMLVRLLLEIQELGIDAAAALCAHGPVIHAVAAGQAVRQRRMHAHYQGPHIFIGRRAIQHALQPTHLLWQELVERSVIQVNKIHSTLYPVEISLRRRVLRIVRKTLLAEGGSIQPFGECFSKLLARLGQSGFMIADAHKDRHGTKRPKLVLDEIIPGVFQVVVFCDGLAAMLRAVLIVLIDGVDGTQVAQMPIERGVVLCRGRRDGGHHDVTAVA